MMFRLRLALFAALAGIVAVGHTQQSGWVPGQVNASMCMWKQPRGKFPACSFYNHGETLIDVYKAAVIRDTVYIDGGFLYWTQGMNDGTVNPPYWDGKSIASI
jgi:hypothetical protein